MTSNKHSTSSDGNLLNFGNADATGANVNRNRPDNANDNLGAESSRRNHTFSEGPGENRTSCAVFILSLFVSLIQFPIILPISRRFSESCAKPASFKHCVLCASRRCIESILSMVSILLMIRSFDCFCFDKAK